MVFQFRPRREQGHQAVPDQRPCEQALRCRRVDGHQLQGADRSALRRHSWRMGQSAGSDSWRFFGAAGSGRADHGRADGF